MTILTKSYNELPFCKKEILRYLGCVESTSEVEELLNSCIEEIKNSLVYKVCYCELNVKIYKSMCDFGLFEVTSKDLAHTLKGKTNVLLFGATIGLECDRLIAKYGRIAPSRALMFQAIGTEQIESLCNIFCSEMGYGIRFSPGYGDLTLDLQKNIFDVLDCGKRIGLTLNRSMLMSPTKSVTAFAVEGKSSKCNCETCNKTDCIYRGVL